MTQQQRVTWDAMREALKGFVDEYDTDAITWPDDMVDLLTMGTIALRMADATPIA